MLVFGVDRLVALTPIFVLAAVATIIVTFDIRVFVEGNADSEVVGLWLLESVLAATCVVAVGIGRGRQ